MKQLRPLSIASVVVAASLYACSSGDDAPKASTDSAANLELPGVFYPQSITSASDGTLFVGSIGTGEVVKYAPGSTQPQVIVAKSDPQVLIPGLVVDDASSTLWVTAVKFDPGFANPRGELRSYDFEGHLKKTYLVPNQGSSIGEEPTIGPDHGIYVTDAFLGKVYVLKSPDGALQDWAASDLLKSTDPEFPPFGAHGIAWDGAGNFYVNNYNASRLVRLPIEADGRSGTASEVNVKPALVHPEGLRMIDGKTLVATEHAGDPRNGRLTLIALGDADQATGVTLRDHLKTPTNVTLARGSFWITEGQTDQFLAGAFGGTPAPQLPFLVQRATKQ